MQLTEDSRLSSKTRFSQLLFKSRFHTLTKPSYPQVAMTLSYLGWAQETCQMGPSCALKVISAFYCPSLRTLLICRKPLLSQLAIWVP